MNMVSRSGVSPSVLQRAISAPTFTKYQSPTQTSQIDRVHFGRSKTLPGDAELMVAGDGRQFVRLDLTAGIERNRKQNKKNALKMHLVSAAGYLVLGAGLLTPILIGENSHDHASSPSHSVSIESGSSQGAKESDHTESESSGQEHEHPVSENHTDEAHQSEDDQKNRLLLLLSGGLGHLVLSHVLVPLIGLILLAGASFKKRQYSQEDLNATHMEGHSNLRFETQNGREIKINGDDLQALAEDAKEKLKVLNGIVVQGLHTENGRQYLDIGVDDIEQINEIGKKASDAFAHLNLVLVERDVKPAFWLRRWLQKEKPADEGRLLV